MSKSETEMPEAEFSRAKRVVRKHEDHERLPLSAVRAAVGKTQSEVAAEAGVPQAGVSRLESRVARGAERVEWRDAHTLDPGRVRSGPRVAPGDLPASLRQ
jgi:Helix-turn-helix